MTADGGMTFAADDAMTGCCELRDTDPDVVDIRFNGCPVVMGRTPPKVLWTYKEQTRK